MTEQEFFADFLNHYSLPEEERTFFLKAADGIFEKEYPALSQGVSHYYACQFQIGETLNERETLAEKCGLSVYTVNFIFLVTAACRIKPEYEKKKIPESVFYDTFSDLLVKASECQEVKGVYGIFVEGWYRKFFMLMIFRLGRLEYEIKTYTEEPYRKDDFCLNPGDPVIGVHIPSHAPFHREVREESYRLAYEFFQDHRKPDGSFYLVCESWLLYGALRGILPEKSNVRDFLWDFDLLKSWEEPSFPDAWRLYSVDYDGHPEKLPRKNSMQKSIAEWLDRGGFMGRGLGIRVMNENGRIN